MGMGTAAANMNSELPECSVLIPNFNGKEVVGTCIESVFSQARDFGIEVIVHDDASTDGSPEFIRDRYPQVKLIESRSNVGFCISCNRMAAAARGRYLLLLNNDAALRPDALQTLHDAALRELPCILGLSQYNAATGGLIDIGSLLDPFLNPVPNLDPSRREVGMVIGACMWLPRSLWDDLGGFPEWFGSLAEDMYLCCLARLNGFRTYALAQSGYVHQVGYSFGGGKVVSNRLSTRASRRALSERNKTYVMCICYPLPLLLLILPVHLVSLALEGAVLAAVKNSRRLFVDIYLYCLVSVWKNRHMLLEKRRKIQRERKCNVREFCGQSTWVPYKLAMLVRHGFPEVSN